MSEPHALGPHVALNDWYLSYIDGSMRS